MTIQKAMLMMLQEAIELNIRNEGQELAKKSLPMTI